MIKRGDIVYLKDSVNKPLNSRPFLIVSNDIGNHFANICLGVPLTTKHKKVSQPTHCVIGFNGSMVLTEQIYTINKDDINRVIGRIDEDDMRRVSECLKVSLALNGGRYYEITP